MKRQKFAAWAVFILIFLVEFISCGTTADISTEEEPLSDYSLDRIDNLLEAGENLRAIPLILRRQQDGGEVGHRYEAAIQGLETEWNAARNDGDWRSSLVYLRSFRILGIDDIAKGITENDLILEGIQYYLDNGYAGAAAAMIQTDLMIDDFTQDQRSRFAHEFDESGHRTVAAFLRNEETPGTPGMMPLVNGTVTVWVNRGIRLVGNVGVPDRGIGSGFFIDSQGYLLTNYHVIESEVDPEYQGYSRLYIKVDDDSGDRFPAKVVGYDKDLDLALLKTEMDVPYVFSFSDQEVPDLGEIIHAIGSPGGLTKSLTSGTVSAYARSIQPMAGSLQIDVPINPGNSGGPLLNGDGEVIGVVFAGVESYEGVNFAIPGEYVKRLIPMLYEGGGVELPWLGMSAWDSTGNIAITYVVPGSPAADAGLQPGDVLTTVDGYQFSTIRGIQEYLISRIPGTITSLSWERDGVKIEGIAALAVRPDIPLSTALSRDAREHLLTPLFGFILEQINGHGIYQNYRVKSVLPGSIADEAGFTSEDTLSVRKWIHDEEHNIVAIQILIKGRKAGFLESMIQLASHLDVHTVF